MLYVQNSYGFWGLVTVPYMSSGTNLDSKSKPILCHIFIVTLVFIAAFQISNKTENPFSHIDCAKEWKILKNEHLLSVAATLQIFKALQVNYRKMMVDVTRKIYYSLVAHQRLVGFLCYSYMNLQVCTVICYCHY